MRKCGRIKNTNRYTVTRRLLTVFLLFSTVFRWKHSAEIPRHRFSKDFSICTTSLHLAWRRTFRRFFDFLLELRFRNTRRGAFSRSLLFHLLFIFSTDILRSSPFILYRQKCQLWQQNSAIRSRDDFSSLTVLIQGKNQEEQFAKQTLTAC